MRYAYRLALFFLTALWIAGCGVPRGGQTEEGTAADPNCGYHPLAASPTQRLCFEDRDGLAVVEGDIVLGTTESLRSLPRSAVARAQGASYRWPNATIPYLKPPTESLRQAWEETKRLYAGTIIRFEEITVPPRFPAPYLVIVDVMVSGGFVFGLGAQAGENRLHAGIGCDAACMAHELGHLLGFAHEHNREDRDRYVTVLWNNIPMDRRGQYDRQIRGAEDLGPYDFLSIMHYGGSFRGNVEMIRNDGGVIRTNNALSADDVAAVNRLYGNFFEAPSWRAEEGEDALPPVRLLSSTEVALRVAIYTATRGDTFVRYATSPHGPWTIGAHFKRSSRASYLSYWEPRIGGLTPNQRYYFQVWSQASGIPETPDCSSRWGTPTTSACLTAEIVTTAGAPPAAPRNLMASNGAHNEVLLAWEDVSGEDMYLIESDDGGGTWKLLDRVGGDKTAYRAMSLKPLTQYRFRVRAQNGNGDSEPSNVAVITSGDIRRATPGMTQNVRVEVSSVGAKLTWEHGGTNTTGYRVLKSDSASGPWTMLEPLIPHDKREALVRDLLPGSRTWMTVVAINNTVRGFLGNVVQVDALPAGSWPVPGQPTDLRVVSTTSTTARLAWGHHGGTMVTGFELERMEMSQAIPTGIAIGADVREVTVTGLQPSTAYQFRLKARNGELRSFPSSVVRAVTAPVAEIPPVVTVGASTLTPGGKVTFRVTNPPTSTAAWVGLAPTAAPVTSYVNYTYLNGATAGEVSIPSGTAAGTYELRLYKDSGYTLVARSSAFTIGSATGSVAPISIALAAAGSSLVRGGRAGFTLSGAAPAGAWIGLASPGSAATAYVAWTYPSGTGGTVAIPSHVAVGSYELRLYDAAYRILSRTVPFAVR